MSNIEKTQPKNTDNEDLYFDCEHENTHDEEIMIDRLSSTDSVTICDSYRTVTICDRCGAEYDPMFNTWEIR